MTVYIISKNEIYVRTAKNVTNIALANDIYTLTVVVGEQSTYLTYSKNDYYIQISVLEE